MELSRCLLDSLSQEGLSVKLTGKLARPSAQQLTAFLHQFRSVSSLTVLLINCSSIRGLPMHLWCWKFMLMSCCSIAKLFFFRGHQDAVISQKSVIQLACAVLETLESPSNKHWEQMASIEKVGCTRVKISSQFWTKYALGMILVLKIPLSVLSSLNVSWVVD